MESDRAKLEKACMDALLDSNDTEAANQVREVAGDMIAVLQT
jgi:hypothetical protein